MCRDCYDYDAAVLFNAYSGDLWRRFITYLPRHLARLAGVTQKTLHAYLRIRFVKVAEYQARGVVHFHAVIRLDAPGDDYQPPPFGYTATLLCDAIGQAAAAVALAVDHDGQAVTLGFGPQTDTRIIRDSSGLPGTGRPSTGRPWPTTSPSTPPRPSPPPACPRTGCGSWARSRPCAARRTTGR